MLSGESFPPTSSQTFSPAIGHGVLARWSVFTLRLPVIGHLPDGRVFFFGEPGPWEPFYASPSRTNRKTNSAREPTPNRV